MLAYAGKHSQTSTLHMVAPPPKCNQSTDGQRLTCSQVSSRSVDNILSTPDDKLLHKVDDEKAKNISVTDMIIVRV